MINDKDIEKIVIEVLKQLGEYEEKKSGVTLFKKDNFALEPFESAGLGDKVRLLDVVTDKHCPTIGAGVMEMDSCSFPWTLNYDEIDIVLEGTLEITCEGKKVVGKPGDIILIPKGSSIYFGTPDKVRFYYTVYPVNWADQTGSKDSKPEVISKTG